MLYGQLELKFSRLIFLCFINNTNNIHEQIGKGACLPLEANKLCLCKAFNQEFTLYLDSSPFFLVSSLVSLS